MVGSEEVEEDCDDEGEMVNFVSTIVMEHDPLEGVWPDHESWICFETAGLDPVLECAKVGWDACVVEVRTNGHDGLTCDGPSAAEGLGDGLSGTEDGEGAAL